MPWDPVQYERFRRERAAPFEDLMAMVAPRPAMGVIDLGCGTGELTARLADELPDAQVTGIDASPEMLEQALPRARPNLTFREQRVEEVEGVWDLVFSNAVIQWIDDHERLVPKLLSLLRPGGQLVVQLPSNHSHVTHRIIDELAAGEFEADLLGWRRRIPVLPVERYAELLHGAGGLDLQVLEKVYCHLLPASEELVEWTKGTALVPYLERLAEPRRAAFLERYRERVVDAVGGSGGEVLYPFRRILFSARVAGDPQASTMAAAEAAGRS